MTDKQKERLFDKIGVTRGAWKICKEDPNGCWNVGRSIYSDYGRIADTEILNLNNKQDAVLMSQAKEMFFALVEQTIFIETAATSGGKAENPGYSAIKVIESASGKPWSEIQQIYKECME